MQNRKNPLFFTHEPDFSKLKLGPACDIQKNPLLFTHEFAILWVTDSGFSGISHEIELC
jgi:hypothetical protein